MGRVPAEDFALDFGFMFEENRTTIPMDKYDESYFRLRINQFLLEWDKPQQFREGIDFEVFPCSGDPSYLPKLDEEIETNIFKGNLYCIKKNQVYF